MSSGVGHSTSPIQADYSASKWGIRGITKSAAMELGNWGIRVNTIAPGLVMTPLVEGSDDFIDALGQNICCYGLQLIIIKPSPEPAVKAPNTGRSL